ncbi:MAG: leucyl aminopeptidase [Microgenomates group bacterium]
MILRPFMKVTVSKPNLSKLTCDVLVLGVLEGSKNKEGILKDADEISGEAISRFLVKNPKFGKLFDSAIFHISPKSHKTIEKVIIFGLGKESKLDNFRVKQASAAVGKFSKKGAKSVALYFPKEVSNVHRLGLVVNGFILGTFDSGHNKTEKSEIKNVENLQILTDLNLDESQKSAENGLVFAIATNAAREVVNLPANIVNPKYMVEWARDVAKENKLTIKVFNEEEVDKMGAGIMASVAKGSEEDLYFVTLEYKAPGAKKTLALVGKGITFDSGGLSIKPSENMEWMKMDMAGAAAVIAAIDIIAKVKLNINVVAAVPLTENLPGGKATKPGDVVKGLSGKTVEVINTDAEGRLVLSDALTYVQKEFKVDYIVDVATLTGAAQVALGNWAAAIMGRPNTFIESIIKASSEAGERYWQLPLYDEYRDQLKSYIADIANVSSTRGGGAETGAKFLEEFVDENVDWAHLDIAANAWEEGEKPYAVRGATGVAVSTMVQLAINLSK